MRDVLADERLRLGLLLASPALDSRLDGYLRDTGPRPGDRLRKIERSALTYLYRTACKTSPFSTFTGIGSAPSRATRPTAGPRCAPARTG